MPREIGFDELKTLADKVLQYVDKVCRKYDITYYLAYGTLLGAVRHKGFIPWDDDIDVIMDRKNFENFIRAAREDDDPRYRLMWLTESDEYDLPLPKVVDTATELIQAGRNSDLTLGVWVDILVIDDVPDEPKTQKKVLKKYDFYEQCWNWSQYESFSKMKATSLKSLLRNTLMKLLALPGSRRLAERMYQRSNRYNNKGYETFTALTFVGTGRKPYKKEWLGKGTTVTFEGHEYNAPENWDAYLKATYGDYMKLPAVEQRVCRHEYSVFYKE